MPLENTHDENMVERIALCRELHFFRHYLGIKIRVALDEINARREPAPPYDFNQVTDWYLWFGIGREAIDEPEWATPVAPPPHACHSHALMNALRYEAVLQEEQQQIQEKRANASADLRHELDLQLTALSQTLDTMQQHINTYWQKRHTAL